MFSTNVVYPRGRSGRISLAASDKIAIKSQADAVRLYKYVGAIEEAQTRVFVTEVAANTDYTSAAVTAATDYEVEAGADKAYYSVGTSPVVVIDKPSNNQAAPNALNATGTLTAAMMLGGIVTSTTAAAVTATLDTGAITDGASSFAIGDSVDWAVINTGGSNAITVTASTGHTVVGAGAVANSTSGLFRTRKTAADTFVTYRLA